MGPKTECSAKGRSRSAGRANLAAERTAAYLRLGILIGLGPVGLGFLAGVYSDWIATIFALNLAFHGACRARRSGWLGRAERATRARRSPISTAGGSNPYSRAKNSRYPGHAHPVEKTAPLGHDTGSCPHGLGLPRWVEAKILGRIPPSVRGDQPPPPGSSSCRRRSGRLALRSRPLGP
jgi:hypothetical protein